MPRVDAELEYDERVEEARPVPRRARPRPRHRRPHERWRRIAEASLPAVVSNGGYSYTQHSHERENARRLRQMAQRRFLIENADFGAVAVYEGIPYHVEFAPNSHLIAKLVPNE